VSFEKFKGKRILLRHYDLINYIIKYNIKSYIYGFSEITKKVLKNNELLRRNILGIIDKNSLNLPKKYFNIPIVSPDMINSVQNVVLWGNHVYEIMDLFSESIANVYIDYDYSKNSLLSENFKFILEVPSKTASEYDTNQKFTRLLIKKILYFYRDFYVKHIKFSNDFKIRNEQIRNEQNTIIFSYHSIGDENDSIIRWKEGYLYNMITYDTKGYSGWSSLCDMDINEVIKNVKDEHADNFFNTFVINYIKNNYSKYKQPDIDNFIFPNKFIFFPLQTIHDTVMEHSYFKPLDLIKRIIEILSNKNINIVIKKHPKCNNKELFDLLEFYVKRNKIILYEGSIHNAISKATTIYTINSGVGFESLLHLKPVVTFGKSDYMQMTRNIKNLECICKEPFYYLNDENKKLIKKFIYFYINETSFFIDDEDSIDSFIYKTIQRKFKWQ